MRQLVGALLVIGAVFVAVMTQSPIAVVMIITGIIVGLSSSKGEECTIETQ